jgi:predicted TIM-barrel fold metal-dependent hydrolase
MMTAIDGFAHPATDAGMASLLPYMDDGWRHRFTGLKMTNAPAFGGASHEELAASFNGTDIDIAASVLVPVDAINAWPDRMVATAIVRAANEYFVQEWLPRDERYRLAALVCAQDLEWSAQEVRRVADVARVAAAAIAPMNVLLGSRDFHVLYDACVETNVPLIVFPTGAEGRFIGAPQTAAGAPLSEFERRVVLPQVAQAHIASLVLEGTLARFPGLKIMFAGFGFSWLTALVWRMDMDWRRTRIETPWVIQPPSEYVRQQIRLLVSPSDAPRDQHEFAACADLTMASDTLMFGSDFPYTDADAGRDALQMFDVAVADRVATVTATDFFRGGGDLLAA